MKTTNIKDLMAFRVLQKNGLIDSSGVLPLSLSNFSNEELIEAIKALDDSETHYINATSKLADELSRKELLYPIYGFIVGLLFAVAVFFIFKHLSNLSIP